MKLEEYKILNNTLNLKFNRKFKQIRLVKMEYIDSNMLDTDSLEMRFSKEKDNIIICVRDNIKSVVVYINCIDEIECSYAYYIEAKDNEIKGEMNNEMVLGMGLGEIMKRGGDFFKESKKVYSIKSENIFAEISRR